MLRESSSVVWTILRISHGDTGIVCLSYWTFCAKCADGLLGAELVGELVAGVNVHNDYSLFYQFLKYCDANCDGLASFGVRRQVKCSPVVRCDPEASPEVVLVQPSEDA